MRNLLAQAGRQGSRLAASFVAAALAQKDVKAAKARWREVVKQLAGKSPKLGAIMDEAESNVRACIGFPPPHRAILHSTNPLERLNGEVKRRTDVVGIFPDEAAVTRLFGASDGTPLQCSRQTVGLTGSFLCAFDFKGQVNVAPCRVTVGADLVVGLSHQCACLIDRQRRHLHMHSYRDAKPASLAWPHRSRASHDGSGNILLSLMRDEFNCPAKTRRITGCEQVFRGRRVRQPRPAHFLAYR
jgi:hypothetical protein